MMTTMMQISAEPTTIYSVSRGLLQDWLLGTNEGLWRLFEGELTQVADRLTGVHITTAVHTTRGVFVGAADGIARSRDGQAWEAMKLPEGAPPIMQLCITKAFRTIGIAFATTLDKGLLRTMDAGQTWTPCNLGLTDLAVVALAASPAFQEDYNLFAAFEGGAYRGYKAGSQWERLGLPDEVLPTTSIALTMRSIFVGTASGLWRSDDGATWEAIPEFADAPVLSLASSSESTWLAIAVPGRVARSNDHGQTLEWFDGLPEGMLSIAIGDDGEIIVGLLEQGLWHVAASESVLSR